jgi:hypothetical protein
MSVLTRSRRSARSAVFGLAAVLASTVPAPSRVGAQITTGALDTTGVVADPDDVEGVARAAQAQFERSRIRHLPLTYEPFGGSCDEVVGRLCTTYAEGEWHPVAEDDEIVRMRRALVVELDSLQNLAPTSEWILGQRVWYRAEGGAWEGALGTARACARVPRWWCDALEGFALHGLARFAEAETAFERALDGMGSDVADRWRTPEWPVDSDLRERLEDVEEDPERTSVLLDRMWALADPLYLVEGNDRRTEHYARWTVSRLRDRARNPFRLSWGSDLEQLTVRHGWEVGWERTPTRDFGSVDQVIGHKHPEGRDFMPPGDVLDAPEAATAEDLRADRDRPRSLYAPVYAPVLLPMEGQVAVFPRGRRMVIVATTFLPEDTTLHATHDHPLPWLDPGEAADEPDRIGLFAMPVRDGAPTAGARPAAAAARSSAGDEPIHRVERTGTAEGALMLDLPTAPYVISAESFRPSRRRAGRLRVGVAERPAPEDVATLSDLLLLRPVVPEPKSLEDAVHAALPSPSVRSGQTLAIGWEVVGLGFRSETLVFEVSVERIDRGVLQGLGQLLRLADRPQPLRLRWEEPGPVEPGHTFHYLRLDLPDLDPGRYQVRLVLRTAGRSDAATTRTMDVVGGGA